MKDAESHGAKKILTFKIIKESKMASAVVCHKIKCKDGTEFGISGGAHSIHRGLELVYSTTTALIVNAGSLTHGHNTNIDETSNTTLTLGTAADWYDGSTHSYSGGAGWCYVGVDSSGNIKLLHTSAPDKADDSGNTDGTKLYWYDSGNTEYWRVIGAVYVSTADQLSRKWFQQGDIIRYDTPVSLTTTVSSGAWSSAVTCAMPQISEYGFFGSKVDGTGTSQTSSLAVMFLRANGSTGSTNRPDGEGLYVFGASGWSPGYYGEQESFTDSSQQIQHYDYLPVASATIEVTQKGFKLNIR